MDTDELRWIIYVVSKPLTAKLFELFKTLTIVGITPCFGIQLRSFKIQQCLMIDNWLAV